MPRTAWLYVALILASGAAVTLYALPGLAPPSAAWATWAVLTLGATLAMLFRAVFQTRLESNAGALAYSPALLFLLAGALLLPPTLFVLQVVTCHVGEWIKERSSKSGNLPKWYIQPFNIGVFILAGSAAHLMNQLVPGGAQPGLALLPIAGSVLTVATFQVVNSALVGLVIVLSNRISWAESGIWRVDNLLPDLVMLVLGYAVAAVWPLSPWIATLVLVPLVIIPRSLLVPQLQQEAQLDGKTHLLNARYFQRRFAAELARAVNLQRPCALLMADLDFLRNINNTYGHLAGDAVLGEVGRVIQAAAGEQAIAGRFGGEEFAIALPECAVEQATAVAERVRAQIAATPVTLATQPDPIFVTISIGVACAPEHGRTSRDLVHAADMAVYQAKLTGRDRVVSATALPHSLRLPATGLQDSSRDARAGSAGLVPPPAQQAADLGPGSTPADPGPGARPGSNARATPAESGAGNWAAAVKRPRRGRAAVLVYYVGCVIILGCVAGVLGSTLPPRFELLPLAIFGILAAAMEIMQVNIYGPATTSVSVAVVFAAGVVGGMPGVVVASGLTAAAHYLRQRPAPYKTVFNWATYVLAGTAVVSIMRLAPVPANAGSLLPLLPFAVAAALAQYLLNTCLVAGAIALASGTSIATVWRQQFQWLVGHYLVLGTLGLLLALAYQLLGPLGTMLFVLPMLMMRYAQRQYVDQTKNSIQELTRMNCELADANGQLVVASQAIRELNDELFMTLARILDARDPYVAGHSEQVGIYAAATARALGLPEERVQVIHQAGLLHDLGKIAIPERILHKPARLTTEEYEQLKTHAAIGADFLRTSRSLHHLAPFVRSHHEHWDGRGYPDGLRGEMIPMEARILAICDAVEAMASDRPYHRAASTEEIIAELRRCRGTQFDPQICDAFIGLVEQAGREFIVNSAREVVRRKIALVPDSQRASPWEVDVLLSAG